MIIFERYNDNRNNEFIRKYEVIYNKEEIIKLRKELIDKFNNKVKDIENIDIIKIIGMFLNNDSASFDELRNYNSIKNGNEDEIIKLDNEINKMNNYDNPNEKINKLIEFKTLLEKLNYEQEINKYYDKLLNLIRLEKVGKISQMQVEQAAATIDFFNDSYNLYKYSKRRIKNVMK